MFEKPVLLIGNDVTIEVAAFRDTIPEGSPPTLDYVNSATVWAEIKTMSGASIGGSGSPPIIEMPYVAGSAGVYRGVIEDSTPLEVDTYYIVEIHGDAGG